MAILLREDKDGIATLTLNRPNSGNSLSHELVHALQSAWDGIDHDESVRVVVLAASGRLFCTGHDLNESIAAMDNPPSKLAANRACSKMMQSMLMQSKPIIAKVHGVATASGCQLMATCSRPQKRVLPHRASISASGVFRRKSRSVAPSHRNMRCRCCSPASCRMPRRRSASA